MPKVIIYSSKTCGYCKQAKDYLRELGVEYIEKDVNSDFDAQRDMALMKATGVPVIKVDDDVVIGFDKVKLKNLITKKIIECPKCRKKLRIPRNKGILQVECSECKEKFRVDSGK